MSHKKTHTERRKKVSFQDKISLCCCRTFFYGNGDFFCKHTQGEFFFARTLTMCMCSLLLDELHHAFDTDYVIATKCVYNRSKSSKDSYTDDDEKMRM